MDNKKLFVSALMFFCIAGFLTAEAAEAADAVTGNMQEIEELRDPTAPLVMVAGQPQTNLFSLVSSYKVSSILIRPNMKVAVINSRQVREGDIIGNAEVVNIEKNSVTLHVAGEEQILELYGRSIKTLNKGEE